MAFSPFHSPAESLHFLQVATQNPSTVKSSVPSQQQLIFIFFSFFVEGKVKFININHFVAIVCLKSIDHKIDSKFLSLSTKVLCGPFLFYLSPPSSLIIFLSSRQAELLLALGTVYLMSPLLGTSSRQVFVYITLSHYSGFISNTSFYFSSETFSLTILSRVAQ